MKHVLLAGVAAIAFGVLPAAAADIPPQTNYYRTPVAAPIPFSWTGFYIGGHVGYGWSSKDWSQTFSSLALALDRSVNSADVDGFLGGVQVGYNWQTGRWVLGVEGDWSWTNADGCTRFAISTNYAGCTNANWYSTVTGRLGYSWDRALVYVKGGAAFANEDHFITFGGTQVTNTASATRTGWTVGVGVEYALSNNWSAKVEYNYMDFGSRDFVFGYRAAPAGLVESWRIDQSVNVVKLGAELPVQLGPGGSELLTSDCFPIIEPRTPGPGLTFLQCVGTNRIPRRLFEQVPLHRRTAASDTRVESFSAHV